MIPYNPKYSPAKLRSLVDYCSQVDRAIIYMYLLQADMMYMLSQRLKELFEQNKFSLADNRMLEFFQHNIQLFVDSLPERPIWTKFERELRGLDLQFVCRFDRSCLVIEAGNEDTLLFIKHEFREAAHIDVAYLRAKKLYDEAQAKKLAEKQKFDAETVYPTRIYRAEYPGDPYVKRLTPTEMRDSGLMPEGYELVPVTVLGLLIHAGENTYSCAVGQHETAIQHAAKAMRNVLTRRSKFRGTP